MGSFYSQHENNLWLKFKTVLYQVNLYFELRNLDFLCIFSRWQLFFFSPEMDRPFVNDDNARMLLENTLKSNLIFMC